MKKLLLCAAAAALAGASVASAAATDTTNNYRSNIATGFKSNYDAGFALRAMPKPAAKGNKLRRSLSPITQQHALKPVVSYRSQNTLRNETDAKLGVTTFLWADPKSSAVPLTPLKSDTRVETGARSFLNTNAASLGLSKTAVTNARVVDRHDTGSGPLITRFQQTQGGIDVFGRQINVMMDRNLRPIASSGYFTTQTGNSSFKGVVAPKLASFDVSMEKAISTAFSDMGGKLSSSSLSGKTTQNGYTQFKSSASSGTITLKGSPRAKKVYYPSADAMEPAYYVEVSGTSAKQKGALAFGYVISAATGKVLFRKNLTEYEAFTYRTWADATGENRPYDSPLGSDFPNAPLTTLSPAFNPPRTPIPSSVITIDHGPISTGDPWLTAAATETTGNNVDAYIDLAGKPGEDPSVDVGGYDPDLGDFRAGISAPLTFDYSFQADGDPITDTARRSSIVNLFYMNNWLHDFWYDVGFNEVAGNGQLSNYGRGGKEGDPIQAQAQDWGGRNNANMTTPADGGSPTMQMYLFDGLTTLGLDVTTPALGSFDVGTASYGPTSFNATGDIVAAVPATGCDPLSNSAAVTGKIVLINRGTCSFKTKTLKAETAGAIGVIIANNAAGTAPGLGDDTTLPAPTIGTVSVSQADGTTISNAIIAGPVSGSTHLPTSTDEDGTVDNGIVAHEFFHHVSNRLVSDGSGLVNQQGRGMGEGWSDVSALLLTVHEGDDAIAGNENFGGAYSTAAYATNDTYFGIRRAPYSVNPAVFPMTFTHIQDGVPLPTTAPLAFGQDGASNSEVHNAGEIWANTLWGFYVSLLNDSRYSFTDAQKRFQQYVIAGLKMTPFAPTFLEARDGILAAAKATDQADFELAAKAFAKMGMGVGAVAPDRSAEDDVGVTESFVALAGGFVVSDVSLNFSFENGKVGYRDLDGVLDAGETAEVTVSIQSNGTQDLTNPITVALSTDGDVSFPNGATVTFPAVDADGSSTATFLMTLNSAATASDLTLTLAFPQEGATADTVIEPSDINLTFAVNYDIQPNVFATDSVDVPLASQADWTSAFLSGSGDQWSIVASEDLFGFDLSGKGWYIPDNGIASDVVLTSPEFDVGTSTFTFSFDSFYEFEFAGTLGDGTPVSYDGGVLEVSIDGGAYVDVTAAGGTFTQNGYSGLVLVFDEDNGREGFADTNSDFLTSTVSFGTTLAGKKVRFRFRAASDQNTGEFGWFIDDISATGVTNLPFSDVVADGAGNNANRPPHVTVPADFSTPERATGSSTQAVVTLAGSALDLDGTSDLTYLWTQTAGTTVTLTRANTATASFTAPLIKADTLLTFKLTVTDPAGATDSKSVNVTLLNVNTPTTLSVSGPSKQGVGKSATFVATASDPDGALTYAWVQTSGPAAATLSGITTPTLQTTTDTVGNYVFTLTTTDPEGSTAVANVQYEATAAIKGHGGGSFDWLMIMAGLSAFGLRRRRQRLD
jgi:hypothetical protein